MLTAHARNTTIVLGANNNSGDVWLDFDYGLDTLNISISGSDDELEILPFEFNDCTLGGRSDFVGSLIFTNKGIEALGYRKGSNIISNTTYHYDFQSYINSDTIWQEASAFPDTLTRLDTSSLPYGICTFIDIQRCPDNYDSICNIFSKYTKTLYHRVYNMSMPNWPNNLPSFNSIFYLKSTNEIKMKFQVDSISWINGGTIDWPRYSVEKVRLKYFIDYTGLGNFSGIKAVNNYSDIDKDNNISVIPNPFNPSTQISISKNLQNSNVSIYGLHGKKVKEWKELKESSVIWNASGYSSGVYILKVVNGVKEYSTRLVLQK